jgi:uncharacterized iron-regulated membrane protein
MAGGGIWAKVHKWLALLMAIQILFWFVSGLFFAAVPIETVRSEQTIAEQSPPPVDLDAAAAGLARLAGAGIAPGQRIEVRTLLRQPVALVGGGEARPRLYDLTSGRILSPVPVELAARIAEADNEGDARAIRVEAVSEASPEYRGALPAWRVTFEGGLALYVAQDSGAVTARRSTLWRVYDFLWGLHIMDWRGHEDFNSPLLVVATALGLIVIVSGMIMFPSRLGFTAWLRRRRARINAGRTPAAGRPE